MSRTDRRRVRWFFAGLLVVSAVLDIVGALLIHHQTRAQELGSVLPPSISLGGRTGAVLSGLALLLLASGIARGKRAAHRLTLAVLVATIFFQLVKDLDFEIASLNAWILFGLWWFRDQFEADTDPARARFGMAALVAGVGLAVLYAMIGTVILGNQLQPEVGLLRTLESLAATVAGSPGRYHAVTERADWFLSTLPIVSYALVIIALTQLLRPVLAPRAVAADRERLQSLLGKWGRNHISHLAVHGTSSYHWIDGRACVAFTLRGRTALALGDPIGPPDVGIDGVREFTNYCDRQDWTPAFYQVDGPEPYRSLGMALVPIGSEALIETSGFDLKGKARADLRHAVHRSEREGVRFTFAPGPQVLEEDANDLQAVSGRWLESRNSPELGYSLGTLATLSDPEIVVGRAVSASGRLEAFVSWLPVPARNGWTLDLMRRRPDSAYGVMEALIVRSIQEAAGRGIVEVSLGVAPRIIAAADAASGGMDRAMRAMFWSLDRFQRSRTLRRFKEKFGPCWEDRYLAVPGPQTLPEVMVALVRAHLPPLSRAAVWLRSRPRDAEAVEGRTKVLA
ncbi:MAG TPA: phosphatidylglycerol lysyltransferase domain-containing protein [Candidatus Dormibacteraeota bacterium]|nr:phosphatidylglycerol lysyltransferase domain-containing protein [Candidatus Dormibacteraeota bacterium]